MGGEGTKYSTLCLLFCLLLTVKVVLSINSLSPGPVEYVIKESNLTLWCSTESIWTNIFFFDPVVRNSMLAVVVFQANNETCENIYTEMAFGRDKYIAQPCFVDQPVGIIINNISTSYHNKTITCQVESGTPQIGTIVKIREKLTSPKLETKDTITRIEGESISIQCTAKSIPKAEINWYISDTIMQGDIQTSSPTEKDMISNISFTAKRSYDNMKLYCSGNDTFTSLNSSLVTLDIQYLPIVSIYPASSLFTVVENTTNFKLNCDVTAANPIVTSFNWYKNGSTIETVATYTILTVNRTDSGIYTCDATNSIGTTLSPSLQLNVLYLPKVAIYPASSPYTVVENTTNFKLNCYVTGANPIVTSYNWYKNGSTIATFASYIISTVNRSDTGSYTCDATNSVGTTLSSTLQLNVLYGVEICSIAKNQPLEGGLLNITCKGQSYPAMRDDDITWTKQNYAGIIMKGHHLVIDNVNRIDSGTFICSIVIQLTPNFGQPVNVTGKTTAEVNVLYDVTLELSDREINVKESERWKFSGISDGNPQATITCVYIFNSSIVGVAKSNVTVSVEHANCIDTGLYMCTGNNTIGTPVSKSAHIKVACKPRTYNNMDKQERFVNVTDKNLKISSKFISFPLSKIVWYRQLPGGNLTDIDSEFAQSTTPSYLPYETIAILQKDNLNQDEFGIYLVNASNIHGSFIVKYHVFDESRDKYALKEENNSMFSAGIASLVVGLLFFIAAITFIFRKRLKKNDTKSHQSNDYADLHVRNPTFQDQYTSLQNPIVSMETSANTYDDCEHASDVAAYPKGEVTISGQTKAEKNEGIYDNVKI